MRFDEEDGLVFGHKLIPRVCGKHDIKGEVEALSVLQRDPERNSSWTQVVDMTSSRRIEPINLD